MNFIALLTMKLFNDNKTFRISKEKRTLRNSTDYTHCGAATEQQRKTIKAGRSVLRWTNYTQTRGNNWKQQKCLILNWALHINFMHIQKGFRLALDLGRRRIRTHTPSSHEHYRTIIYTKQQFRVSLSLIYVLYMFPLHTCKRVIHTNIYLYI